jgi:pyridoxal 5'-phosphate synthase pdxT subunit
VNRLPGERLDRRSPRGGASDVGPSAVGAEDAPAVGVLALQGDVLEHVRALAAVGLRPVAVRTPAELAGVVALVLPGGESTAISRALERGGLAAPLAERVRSGMPVLGTCAGLILLSDELTGADDALPRPRGLAVRTRRNAYGPQAASFDVRFAVAGLAGGPLEASFIRAPRIESILDPSVEVLATVDGTPVAVRQGAIIAMSFHPEVAGDHRMHALLADIVRAGAGR